MACLAAGDAAHAARAASAGVRTASVDGRRTALRVMGEGRPVVVLIAGLGDGMDSFAGAAAALGTSARVIVYDRAGYGGSDAGPGPRDAASAERELSGLLAASGVAGPYVLVGHSLGGLFAEYYAARHPDQVAGLILEESRPADFAALCEATPGTGMCMPPAAMLAFSPRGAKQELAGLRATEAEVRAVAPLTGRPVLVLSRPTAAKGAAPFETVWARAQDGLAARYPGSTHLTVPGGGHYLHKDQSQWFVGAVRAFLERVPAG